MNTAESTQNQINMIIRLAVIPIQNVSYHQTLGLSEVNIHNGTNGKIIWTHIRHTSTGQGS